MNGFTKAVRRRRVLRFVLSRILWRSRLCERLRLWTPMGGMRVMFHPSAMSASFWEDPSQYRDDIEFLSAYLRPGDAFVDVGANVGILSLVAADAVGPRGRVVAIEAHPRVFEHLQDNFRANRISWGKTVHAAIGSGTGSVQFSDARSDDQNSVVDGGPLSVSVYPLDDVVSDVGVVSLLKVDVEGYEKFVLEGAAKTLARTHAVYFEAWEDHYRRYSYSTNDIVRALTTHGFRVYRRTSAGLREVGPDYRAERCENLLGVRDVEFFRARVEEGVAARAQ